MNEPVNQWISAIQIENFKSIESARLELGPLTVLVGANSAGKSSILQAIFLLAQIVRGHSQSSLVNLNGDELRLGTYADIRHAAPASEPGQPAFTIDFDAWDAPRRPVFRTREAMLRQQAHMRGIARRPSEAPLQEARTRETLRWKVVLGPPDKTQSGSATLQQVKLEATRADGKVGGTFTTRTSSVGLEDEVARFERLIRVRRRFSFGKGGVESSRLFNADLAGAIMGEGEAITPDQEYLASIENAIPEQIFTIVPDSGPLAEAWLGRILMQIRNMNIHRVNTTQTLGPWEEGFARLKSLVTENRDASVPIKYVHPDGYRLGVWAARQRATYAVGTMSPERARLLEELPGWKWTAGQEDEENFLGMKPASEIAETIFPAFHDWVSVLDGGEFRPPAVRDLPTYAVDELTSIDRFDERFIEELGRELANWLNREREPKPQIEPVITQLDDLAEELRDRMATAISYLGPLREDPSPAYPPGGGGGIARLGLKGQSTVPELERYGLSPVQAVLPPKPKEGQSATAAFEEIFKRGEQIPLVQATLNNAVDKWMEYLGVATSVRVHGIGRAGIALDIVDSQTSLERNLTDVGVGVSQLLPVVVLCLRAQPGDVVLIEQPELHLHPAPQQALGDFLLAMSLSGRQLIIETHSEYLINRLRLRIAQDDDENISRAVRIIYAERRAGRTNFRPIETNSLGSFDDWPEGFFDQAPKETEAILRAAMAKRRRQREAQN